MRDTTTLVGTPPATAEADSKPRARRLTLAPLKRFTRAHLQLAERPDVRSTASTALRSGLSALSLQLGQPFSAATRLVDATLQPLQHLAREALYVIVELTHASTMALVEIEGPVASHLLHLAAGSDARSSVVNALTRVETAALGWLGLSVISGLRQQPDFEARFGPRLVGVTTDRGEALRSIDAAVRHLCIELQISTEHPLGLARVLVPTKMLQLAIQTAPIADAPPAHPLILDSTLRVSPRFGRAQLKRADLGELGPGDVIVFAHTGLDAGRLLGPARLVGSSFLLTGTLAADGFTVTSTTHPTEESSMSVNVDVEIELTTIALPIRQLGVITPGAVLPLHINAAQTVTLRIEGKAIALAELVEVEGEVGARITALLDGAP